MAKDICPDFDTGNMGNTVVWNGDMGNTVVWNGDIGNTVV